MKSINELLSKNRYWAKLDTEEWRDFSRRVRTERGGCCQVCRRASIELNVHHISYDPNREPWEYGSDEVAVLCRDCHRAMHEQFQAFRKYVFGKFTPQAFRVLNGTLAVALTKFDPLVFCHAVAEFVSTPEIVEKYAKAFEIPEQPWASGDQRALTRGKLLQLQQKREAENRR